MKFIAVKDSLFKTPVFCMQNIYVSILKHRCFETAVRIYFMNYVIILGKKIIFVTELYKYSDENIQVSRFLHIVNIFLMSLPIAHFRLSILYSGLILCHPSARL